MGKTRNPSLSEVVRSALPFGMWEPGHSRCYQDVSYNLTQKKTRWNFTYLEGLGSYTDRQLAELKTGIINALTAAGQYHHVTDVFCERDCLMIYAREPHALKAA
jgi:hypothetical protein